MIALQRKSQTPAAFATVDGGSGVERNVERKTFTLEIKDAEAGKVEAVFSTFNVKDLDDDWTLPGAFGDQETLIGSWGHGTLYGEPPVGLGTIRETAKDARLVGEYFLDTHEGLNQFRTVKNVGPRQQWSYGYHVTETGELTEELRQIGVRRVIKKAIVIEISPVTEGAGIRTRTIVAKERGAEPPAADPALVEPTAEVLAAQHAAAEQAEAQATADNAAALAKAAAEKVVADAAAAALKASTASAVEDYQRILRTHKRLGLAR